MIGLAIHNFHDTNDKLPYLTVPQTVVNRGDSDPISGWSYHVQLLPYIEQQPIDWSRRLVLGVSPWLDAVQVDRMKQVIPGLLCPSDSMKPMHPIRYYPGEYGPFNYVACTGPGAGGGQHILENAASTRLDTGGAFTPARQTRFGDFTDGQSNTVVMSEWTLGTGANVAQPPAAFDVRTMIGQRRTSLATLTDANCQAWANTASSPSASDPADGRSGFTGSIWSETGYGSSFQADMLPNDPRPSCLGRRAWWYAARSRHTGGVNVVLADGSVRFVVDSI